ncbi:urea amidolyase associated protein UAAP1 [Paludibaculum fermentans]|uniref:urea amidolyase associated protein UAAP1 n=1 Tax=Paludibaculum fermentans TaxID=1473598 RepID=UPI003EBEDA1C
MMQSILWEEELRGGQTWSYVLKRGAALRLTDVEGGANVSALFYNADFPEERYNMPDTLKAQHIARLTEGFVLYSDMGHILCSITSDSVGWHDPIGGTLNAAIVHAKYGEKDYQRHRNEWTQSSRESLLLELAKYSLGPRDLTPTVNFFSKVQVEADGSMHYVPGNSKPGAHVELRAEMNVLVLLSANHHPMEPGTVYAPKPVQLTVGQAAPAAADDPCRVSRPENGRGFTLTERYFGAEARP